MAIIPGSFCKNFIGITNEEAHRATDRFDKAEFARGFRGEWEISRRADSPRGKIVNLRLYCRKV